MDMLTLRPAGGQPPTCCLTSLQPKLRTAPALTFLLAAMQFQTCGALEFICFGIICFARSRYYRHMHDDAFVYTGTFINSP